MKHTDESIALQAVEFWSTVCEEEIELAIEAAEVGDCLIVVRKRLTGLTGCGVWRSTGD